MLAASDAATAFLPERSKVGPRLLPAPAHVDDIRHVDRTRESLGEVDIPFAVAEVDVIDPQLAGRRFRPFTPVSESRV